MAKQSGLSDTFASAGDAVKTAATKCLQCLIDVKVAEQEGNPARQAADAVTMAPSWLMNQIGPQQMWACVPLPTCLDHLHVERRSALDVGKAVILAKAER